MFLVPYFLLLDLTERVNGLYSFQKLHLLFKNYRMSHSVKPIVIYIKATIALYNNIYSKLWHSFNEQYPRTTCLFTCQIRGYICYPWCKFYFPLFLDMVMRNNEFETKGNKIQTRDKTEPQHICVSMCTLDFDFIKSYTPIVGQFKRRTRYVRTSSKRETVSI